MKKFLILFCLCLVTEAHAQHLRSDSLGTFSNLNTKVDLATKKERPMTDEEIKEVVKTEITKKLSDRNSTRKVDDKNIAVLGDLVTVPIVEMDGSPFYTLSIDRASGLSGSDIAISKQNKITEEKNQEWLDLFAKQEAKMDESKKIIDEYRKKNPISNVDKFKPTQNKHYYRPKKTIKKSTTKE